MGNSIIAALILAVLAPTAIALLILRSRKRTIAARIADQISVRHKSRSEIAFQQAIGRLIFPNVVYDGYYRLFIRSGFRQHSLASGYLIFKTVLSILAIYFSQTLLSFQWAASFFGAITVWFLPDLFLWIRVKHYRRRIELDMPFWLDLHTSLVEGGMGFDEALSRICGGMNIGGRPLFQELERIERFMQYGFARLEALHRLADELAVPELHEVVSALVQGERLGSGMVDTLRAQADMIRNKVWEDAQQRAHRLPVELVFPIAIGVLPLLFMILIGPSAIRLLQIIGDMGKRF